jgi:hypothetical protein
MRTFLEDTKDIYEQRYGKEICVDFPRYGEFWSKYIGQRKDNFLMHYEIDSSKTSIKEFDRNYERMTIAHYGIFLDLSGVIIDSSMLSVNLYKTIDDVLAYWNTVRNIYSKMGNSIYKYGVFLDHTKDILNIGKLNVSMINKLKKDLESIKEKRDFIVHFSALAFAYDKVKNSKKIPEKIYDDKGRFLPYSEILKQNISTWVDVESQIQSSFKEIETKFNECHGVVLNLFEKYKKFNVIDPGLAITHLGKNFKGDSEFFSSGSGMSGYARPI